MSAQLDLVLVASQIEQKLPFFFGHVFCMKLQLVNDGQNVFVGLTRVDCIVGPWRDTGRSQLMGWQNEWRAAGLLSGSRGDYHFS